MEYLKSKCDELVLKVKELKLLDGSGGKLIFKKSRHKIYLFKLKHKDKFEI